MVYVKAPGGGRDARKESACSIASDVATGVMKMRGGPNARQWVV